MSRKTENRQLSILLTILGELAQQILDNIEFVMIDIINENDDIEVVLKKLEEYVELRINIIYEYVYSTAETRRIIKLLSN